MIRSRNHLEIIRACMERIEHELIRCYWNKYQREMDSPFWNTGHVYENDTFAVRAYDWGDESEETPNFEYRNFRLWWYKHVGRGMVWENDQILTLEFIEKMINDCEESIYRDFGEKS